MSDAPAEEVADPAGPAADDSDALVVHHWWRLIAIWVVLSAILDPLFYVFAGPHIPPGPVSYTHLDVYKRQPQGQWVHTTFWQVPAHTRINVTIYNYDSGSPLRNQQIGLVAGTIGDTATLNGKTIHLINSNAGNGVGHTFSIPTLGINVPLYGNNGNANLCAVAPCTTKSPHEIIKFSFESPGPGQYPWQCFVPLSLIHIWWPRRPARH